MSKSILVMDTPEACIDCPCHFAEDTGRVWCGKDKKEVLADDIETFKPDWCPAKDLPEKYELVSMDFERGYNTCLDEILKRENGNDKGTV